MRTILLGLLSRMKEIALFIAILVLSGWNKTLPRVDTNEDEGGPDAPALIGNTGDISGRGGCTLHLALWGLRPALLRRAALNCSSTASRAVVSHGGSRWSSSYGTLTLPPCFVVVLHAVQLASVVEALHFETAAPPAVRSAASLSTAPACRRPSSANLFLIASFLREPPFMGDVLPMVTGMPNERCGDGGCAGGKRPISAFEMIELHQNLNSH